MPTPLALRICEAADVVHGVPSIVFRMALSWAPQDGRDNGDWKQTMDVEMWPHRPPPSVEGQLCDWTIVSAGELHALRAEVRAWLYLAPGHRPLEPVDERLVLATDELVSHGLRNGDGPVRVGITETAGGWLIEVSDPATGQDPRADVDQAPALPPLGLQLVARLTAGRGWTVAEDRTHMWAHVSAE